MVVLEERLDRLSSRPALDAYGHLKNVWDSVRHGEFNDRVALRSALLPPHIVWVLINIDEHVDSPARGGRHVHASGIVGGELHCVAVSRHQFTSVDVKHSVLFLPIEFRSEELRQTLAREPEKYPAVESIEELLRRRVGKKTLVKKF